ncbi:uncharacterized protein TNCV_842211 [Trichonephila clavipes]|nr:uncharacterized protein TNCV_842211 [Trichonephila clavipes]
MIKVFGDLHPYNFFITHGHSDDKCFTDEDAHILSREKKKLEPFEKLQDMHEEDNKAEEKFHRILSSLESKADTVDMDEFLKERKRECVAVFEQYDEIVALCEEYFNLEYEDIRKRVEEQMALQKPMINEVERYLTEVQDAGEKEISILKRKGVDERVTRAVSSLPDGRFFLADVRGKKPGKMACVRFKADRTTSKRIRYGFITVKSTTLIGLNSPRKNTTLPAIRSVEPRRTHIPV